MSWGAQRASQDIKYSLKKPIKFAYLTHKTQQPFLTNLVSTLACVGCCWALARVRMHPKPGFFYVPSRLAGYIKNRLKKAIGLPLRNIKYILPLHGQTAVKTRSVLNGCWALCARRRAFFMPWGIQRVPQGIKLVQSRLASLYYIY